MTKQKLYAGAKLREIRTRLPLTQKDFANRLGVSTSYLNQMENNHRPVSAGVILALAAEFDYDVTQLSIGENQRMVTDMREALADPVFTDQPPLADLSLTASNAPGVAHAFLTLHRAYRQSNERLASLDEALGREGTPLAPLPWEEVRDFFHYCNNYLDAVDRAAEHFATGFGSGTALNFLTMADWLKTHHHITVSLREDAPLRSYDPANLTLHLSARAATATQIFQLAHQIALIAHNPLLEATLDLANFQTGEARAVCKVGLANYFAGAALLPYGKFLQAARDARHDVEHLADTFGASFEQVAHRLSTLQRPGAKGVPFFFVRVDQAGTVTKRHSATKLQFARFGGACPLWNVHRAFETPGRFLRQLAETPDGIRYICLARDVSKPGGSFRAPVRRYAIALGCEMRHAGQLVYADDLDIDNSKAYEQIGISCRICERRTCHQRAVPPMERAISVDHNTRGTLPYTLD